ncbi:MAG: SDR family oxidoreductase, partial [Myxococcota bacterium]
MVQNTGKTALITGASAGLGSDYARLFAADGHDLVIVARRKDRLDQLAEQLRSQHGVTVHVLPCDLGRPGAAQELCDQLQERDITVEFLVNNAGLGSNGPFAELDLARELTIIAVNVTALVHLTHLLLPSMIARGSGRILNIGSVAGFQAGPYMATYFASKAFVNHFSEALSHELDKTGVTVTVQCPGATETEFAALAGNDKSNLFKGGVATSAEVASHGYRAMMQGKRM